MSAPDHALPHTIPSVAPESEEILRFRMSERQMHWAIAVPFMVCYVTAVVLIAVYNPNPHRPWRQAVSWTHRLSGLCLFVLPAWTIVRHWYDVAIHLNNIREVWRWTLADLKWLLLTGPAMLSRRIILPEQGKFNAGEKINFMVLTVTVPLYLCTGLLIWTHQFAFPAWVVHFVLTAAATPLLLGHVFLATVNPDTRAGLSGMVTGFVNRRWASHHYGRWYKENFAVSGTSLAASGVEQTLRAGDAASTPAGSGGRAQPGPWDPCVGHVSPGMLLYESQRFDPDSGALLTLATATHGSPWAGRLDPVMDSARGPEGTASAIGAHAMALEDGDEEPLPPFLSPLQPSGRAPAQP